MFYAVLAVPIQLPKTKSGASFSFVLVLHVALGTLVLIAPAHRGMARLR